MEKLADDFASAFVTLPFCFTENATSITGMATGLLLSCLHLNTHVVLSTSKFEVSISDEVTLALVEATVLLVQEKVIVEPSDCVRSMDVPVGLVIQLVIGVPPTDVTSCDKIIV